MVIIHLHFRFNMAAVDTLECIHKHGTRTSVLMADHNNSRHDYSLQIGSLQGRWEDFGAVTTDRKCVQFHVHVKVAANDSVGCERSCFVRYNLQARTTVHRARKVLYF